MRGHIYQQVKARKDAWTIVIDLPRGMDGKRQQKSYTVRGKQSDAQKRLRELLHELDQGKLLSGKQTLAQYLEQWLKDYAEINTAPRTYERYAELIRKHIEPALGAIPLTSLQPNHIQAYYGRALKAGRRDGKGGLSARTVHHIHRVLFSALKYAVKHNITGRNIAEAVDPPHPKFREMTAADNEEINRLLESVKDTHYYPIFFTAAYTGLRRSELLGLRWGNIDLDLAHLSVRRPFIT